MAANFTEEQFDSISFDSYAENATWISGNFSLSDSPIRNSTRPPVLGSSVSVSGYVIACFYWLIFVVGITGNLLVVAVVIWKLVKSPEHQAMTIFVGSLAASDLGLLLWVTWINALLSVNPEWMFRKLTCQMYIMLRSQTADCSIVTLMFIALDRCVRESRFLYCFVKFRPDVRNANDYGPCIA